MTKREAKMVRDARNAAKWMQAMFYRLVELKVYDRNGPADRALNQLKHSLDRYAGEELPVGNEVW